MISCDKCGSDNVKLLKEGFGKRGKWQLFACKSGCTQEGGEYAGKGYTFFGSQPTPKAPQTNSKPVATDKLGIIETKLDHAISILNELTLYHLRSANDPLNKSVTDSFGGTEVEPF